MKFLTKQRPLKSALRITGIGFAIFWLVIWPVVRPAHKEEPEHLSPQMERIVQGESK